jgi:hypothetical protein
MVTGRFRGPGMPQQVIDLEHSNVPPHEVQAELEAVLRSPAFERSERLQRFLRFICERTLKGESHRINEYLIGSEVFQRGPEYSPSEDSIVRRQALTLRQKLQEYYAAEGRDHPVRIELPVGRYVPVFRRIEASPTAQQVVAPAAVPAPTPGTRRAVYLQAAMGVALFLAGITVTLLVYKPAADTRSAIPPALTEIWQPWLQPGSPAVICFSSPMTAVIKHFESPLPPDSVPKRFKALPEEEKLFRQVFRLPAGGHIYYTPVVNQTKTGEAISGVHLASLLSKANVPVRSTQSRFLDWEDLRQDNFILLGHNEANHWLELILRDYPFRLVPTIGGRQRGIVNVKPAPGEQSEYQISYRQAETEMDQEYALVSVILGIERNRRMVLINGLNTQATQAATEFLTNEASAGELLAKLKAAAPKHSGPWHFQAILKTEVYDKVPTKATLVALRVL